MANTNTLTPNTANNRKQIIVGRLVGLIDNQTYSTLILSFSDENTTAMDRILGKVAPNVRVNLSSSHNDYEDLWADHEEGCLVAIQGSAYVNSYGSYGINVEDISVVKDGDPDEIKTMIQPVLPIQYTKGTPNHRIMKRKA